MTPGARVITPAQVDAYHREHPGITEALLRRLGDGAGADPYAWLLAALPAGGRGRVLDLACGSAPLASVIGAGWVGVDRSAVELAAAHAARPGAHLVEGDATALPFAGPFDVVLASMALFLLTPLDRALAEVARVLGEGGTFAATVPDLVAGEDAALHRAVLGDLGRTGVGYPEPMEPGTLEARMAAGGLQLAEDERRRFTLTLAGAADARLLAGSYYAPAAGERERAAAATRLCALMTDGPVEVGYGLRRIVATR